MKDSACECVFFLSLNRWPELSSELSWHFTYLSTHFLCQKGICHTCRQQKTKPSHPPVSCSIPRGNVWTWSNSWASWADGEKKEKKMSLSDARDCMKPFNTAMLQRMLGKVRFISYINRGELTCANKKSKTNNT